MTAESEASAETPVSAQEHLSQELNASLSSIWARYAGSRPANASIAIDGSFVRWSVPGGMEELEAGIATVNEEREPGQSARTRAGYERETSAAVAKATHLPVRARICKQDKANGGATESFVLDAPTRQF